MEYDAGPDAAVLRAMDRLAAGERQVLVLSQLANLSTAEIASRTARSPAEVEHLLAAAVQHLARALAPAHV